jgi:poly-gamma-glutamate capsule biosynthesis protein CapA/YwtB (metallophosphatase superfamily)
MNLKKLISIPLLLILFSVTVEKYIPQSNPIPPSNNPRELSINNFPLPLIQPTASPSPTIRLLFTGDINLGRCIARASVRANDFTYPFIYVGDKLRNADITVGSLDGTISNESPPMACPQSMNLIGPEAMVAGLQFAGFDLITVATNHIKDCGEKGYKCDNGAFLDTLKTLTSAGIAPVGGGENLQESRKPVIFEQHGTRFAFLGIDQVDKRVWAKENSPGSAPLSSDKIEQILADIRSAKKIADVVIVLPQWGVEYAPIPEDIQRKWAKEFMDAGATLVVGNGPHIIQPIDVFSNGVAFYALGNFVFDQEQDFRREGVVAEAVFQGNQLKSWQLFPIQINFFTYQPHWVEGSEAKKILDRAPSLPE